MPALLSSADPYRLSVGDALQLYFKAARYPNVQRSGLQSSDLEQKTDTVKEASVAPS